MQLCLSIIELLIVYLKKKKERDIVHVTVCVFFFFLVKQISQNILQGVKLLMVNN